MLHLWTCGKQVCTQYDKMVPESSINPTQPEEKAMFSEFDAKGSHTIFREACDRLANVYMRQPCTAKCSKPDPWDNSPSAAAIEPLLDRPPPQQPRRQFLSPQTPLVCPPTAGPTMQ